MGAIGYWATSQWAAFAEAFHLNFIKAGRWHYLVDGLWVEVPTYLNAKRLLASSG